MDIIRCRAVFFLLYENFSMPYIIQQIYVVHIRPADYLYRIDGGVYDRESYYLHPLKFASNFHLKVPFLPSSPSTI